MILPMFFLTISVIIVFDYTSAFSENIAGEIKETENLQFR